MKITVKLGKLEEEVAEAVVLDCFENEPSADERIMPLDLALGGMITDSMESGDFKGKEDQLLILYPKGAIPAKRLLLLGLGKKEKFNLDKVRQATGRASRRLQEMGLKSFTTPIPGLRALDYPLSLCAQTAVEGILLATYQFTEYKTTNLEEIKKIEGFTLIGGDPHKIQEIEEGARTGEIIAHAVIRVRDLVNRPGNVATPQALADEAKRIGEQYGLKVEILNEEDIKKLQMGCLIAVAQGSQQPPRFIILEHNQPKEGIDTIVLIGKGITFDSGGISIKPSEKMEEMKYDMAGGAAVLGTMQAVATLKLPLHVVGIVPATENLPSGTAYRPGDVIKSFSAKTVEIISTDAEGRLILADALSYAERYKPSAVVDLATLTGACVIALGHMASGLMGNDQGLIQKIKKAGELSGERVWELPLWDEYHEQIKSDIADVKNLGGRPAGAITGGAFLAKFAEKFKWAHLDIAGTAWAEKNTPYIPKGATGGGVRLLIQLLREWNL